MERSKKNCRYGEGFVCQISDVFYGRSLVSIKSLKIFFVFNFLAAIEFRDLKLLVFVYHLIWLLILYKKRSFFVRELQDNRDLIHTDLKQNKHNNHFGVKFNGSYSTLKVKSGSSSCKGQLISKCLFGAIVQTKKPIKFFLTISALASKEVKSKK